MNAYYSKNYAKTVKTRYREDYKGCPCIITKDKAQIDIIRKNYKGKYTLTRPDRQTFKISIEEASR